MIHRACLLLFLIAATSLGTPSQSIQPPFSASYRAVDLGPMPQIGNYGGIAFHPSDPNLLLVSAYGSGRIHAVRLVRDAQGDIAGFGTTTTWATVGGNDGGLAFGPGGVLFFTWYGANRLGQIRPGSTTADKIIDLGPLGIGTSVGSCAFVPSGRPGAGRFKLTTYAGSEWFDVALTPDGNGTFDVAAIGAPVQIQGGPEGIAYPPANAPLLGNSVLVAEWNAGVTVYAVDAHGDPIPSTRQMVMTGLSANGGGAVDPIRGDVLFTGAGGRLVAVRAGGACGTATDYGRATPGASTTPVLSLAGCPRLGQSITLSVQGTPNAFGTLAIGTFSANYTLFGVQVLTNMVETVPHTLDAQGRFALPLAIPTSASYGNTHFYFQAGYLDPGSATGFAASRGLDLFVR